MTIGNISRDYRYDLGGYNNLAGRQFSKTWNGLDSPKTKTKRVPMSVDIFPVTRYKVNRLGKKTYYTHLYKIRRYAPTDRPPKRARRKDDHPYAMSYFEKNDVPFQLSDGRMFSTSGAGYDTNLGPPTWDSNQDLKMYSKLREKVAGSDFNAGVLLGEGKEALGLIADSARRIAKGLFLVRKGRLHDAAHVLTTGTDRWVRKPTFSKGRNTADNWLQLQYGWLPLLSDAESGAQFLAHHFNVPLKRREVVTRKIGVGATCTTTSANVLPLEYYAYTRKTIIAEITEKDVAQLAGLTDPLSVAWELVPYSFVVDWFIPIGQWLSARALSSSLTGKFIVSTKTYLECKGMRYDSRFISESADMSGYHHLEVHFERSITDRLDVQFPKPKSLGAVLSWTRAANAVALLTRPAAKSVDGLTRLRASGYTE